MVRRKPARVRGETRGELCLDSCQLSREQQAGYIDLLLRGASPAAAAQQLGLELFDVLAVIAEDESFQARVDAAYDALSQNVAARLYLEAMKGSVSAMTFWLKNRPPPEWPGTQGEATDRNELDGLSDEELLRLARLEEIAIPPELEADITSAGGDEGSSLVS